MATMQAKYPGTCTVCGQRFPAGTTIEYDRTSRETRHVDCQPFVPPTGAWWIGHGEGYGGEPYTVGAVIRNPRAADAEAMPYVLVLHAASEYYRHDGYSFGVGDESGHYYRACVRVATNEESAALRAAEAKAQAKQHAQATVKQLAQRIRTEGTFAEHGTPMPQGEHLFDTQNIHGSGSLFVVTVDGVWYLERHMMDGDDWAANNVAGTYCGWFLADTEIGEWLTALAAQLAE